MSEGKKDDIAKQDDPSVEDAKIAAEAASKARKSDDNDSELDERLDESFPTSDAPSSTCRST